MQVKEIQMSIKIYPELITLPTFEERFQYLKIDGSVGDETFGFDRYMNQKFYKSKEWKTIRDYVIIRDNGIGIDKEDLVKIFDAYYQGETSSTQLLGVGLGLNLCKEIVKLLEGEISIDSQKNQGTKVAFHLILPRT